MKISLLASIYKTLSNLEMVLPHNKQKISMSCKLFQKIDFHVSPSYKNQIPKWTPKQTLEQPVELNLLLCTLPRQSAMEENMQKMSDLKQAFLIF